MHFPQYLPCTSKGVDKVEESLEKGEKEAEDEDNPEEEQGGGVDISEDPGDDSKDGGEKTGNPEEVIKGQRGEFMGQMPRRRRRRRGRQMRRLKSLIWKLMGW